MTFFSEMEGLVGGGEVSCDGEEESGPVESVRRPCRLCREPGRGVAHRHQRVGESFLECVVAYCDLHGGEERARLEGRETMGSCHFARAPEHLTREEVLEGARMTLMLEHVYVVLRPAGEGRWRFGLGVTHPSKRSYDTKLEAERAGVHAWRWAYQKRLEKIRSARGGDLSWGRPVFELEHPKVVEAGASEAARFSDARPPHCDALKGRVALATNAAERRALRKAREDAAVPKISALAEVLRRDRELGGVLPDREQLEELLQSVQSARTGGV